jgi:predicted SPOUT superfamily RNA methylase MTH1
VKSILRAKILLIQGREYTVSIALPGSVLDNAQTAELRTYLAGQIARAAAIFSVDEIVIFEDVSEGADTSGSEQLARILQYLECPQYLRKHFFPLHKDLQYAGVLNPTDMPHHLR